AKPPIRSQVTHPQFGDLTRSARGGVLIALAAALRAVGWAQPIRELFHLVECVLISLVGGVVSDAVAAVVDSGVCLRRGARDRDADRWRGWTHTARRQRHRHGSEPQRAARAVQVHHTSLTE